MGERSEEKNYISILKMQRKYDEQTTVSLIKAADYANQ